jgi:alginate O-acetyltransferase complex protein AlgI
MVFSSLVFLYIFLPFVLLGLSVCKKIPYQNTFLFLASLLFYSWGGVRYTFILLISILLNWVFGLGIAKYKGHKKLFLTASVLVNLSILVFYKYTNFFIDNVNVLMSCFRLNSIIVTEIVLPIGISFYTFQGISYVIDVYRETVSPQKNFLKLGTYISLFPQLIAGPIIRYKELESQLSERAFSLDNLYEGLKLFIIGLARKVLIANQLAIVADAIFSRAPETLGLLPAWLGIICYTLQIYYDFAGYSDMAIGLGRMFGFSFPENFNFPYIAKSIKEFWRRWHMTLSAWFKDYLYIPLGGNRCSKYRLYFNLYVVFFCTGFWHGASWNFIVWGLWHGTFLVIERIGLGNWLERRTVIFQHVYALLVVMIGWVFFRAENLDYAVEYLKSMFWIRKAEIPNFFLLEYATIYNSVILCIAIVCATPIVASINTKIKEKSLKNSCTCSIRYSVIAIFVLIVMILATNYLINGGYNPFIYFRF